MNESTRDAVLTLEVLPEQHRFIRQPSMMLLIASIDPCRTAMAVLESSRVVGFFVLCRGEQIAHFASGPNTIGVFNFMIDAREQGKGYGTETLAVLNEYLLENHPEFTELNLTVDTANPRAYRAYLRAGFEDAGKLYHGGKAGPQHVLSLPLRRA